MGLSAAVPPKRPPMERYDPERERKDSRKRRDDPDTGSSERDARQRGRDEGKKSEAAKHGLSSRIRRRFYLHHLAAGCEMSHRSCSPKEILAEERIRVAHRLERQSPPRR
jgi:hypothetical protein